MKLLQELFAQGVISEQKMNDLRKEVQSLDKTEEELVLAKKIITEEALFKLKSKSIGIPLQKIKAEEIPSDVLGLIPEEASVNYKMSALSKSDNFVQIGMVYPENIAAQNALRFLAGQANFTYHTYLITLTDLANILKQRRNLATETKKALEELNSEKGKILEALINKSPAKENISEDAPIIKMVLVVLRHAIEGRASDIHIEPGRESLIVRFRQDGVLHPSLVLPMKVHPSFVSRIKILAGLKIDETRVPQDGRFSAKINSLNIDFRVSTFPTLYGEKVEVRVLDPSIGLRSFEELGLSARNLEIVKNAITRPYGMILSVGPTGSGKTTTQYAMLKLLNSETLNIVTIEDPIEYAIPGINQSQVRPEINYTFAQGLRQILRQDPNVIMVGEIRDQETARLATNAALTGHVVLSTLHTNSSAGAIPRLMDMGVDPFLIPSTLKIVISQRLVRMLCSHCKISVRPSEKAKAYILEKIKNMPQDIKAELKVVEPLMVYKHRGCEFCNFTGYSGRIGLFEVLQVTEEVAELLSKNPTEAMIFKLAQKQGMVTMDQEGVLKLLSGQTTLEEITRVSMQD